MSVSRIYTVVGLWCDDAPLSAGAILGEHEVDGDLDYIGFQPWAASIEADTAQDAMEAAVETMKASRHDDDGEADE